MLDIQTLSIVVAAVSVVAGVIYYSIQIRNQNRIRQTALIMGLFSTWLGKELQEADSKVMATEFMDYSDFVRKYGSITSGKPIYMAIRMIGAFHEGIGVLLHRKLIDIGVVDELYAVRVRWEKMKPLIEGLRKHFNEPALYEWFEYLYNEVQKREQTLQSIQ